MMSEYADYKNVKNKSEQEHCGVTEAQFPTMRECCIYSGVGVLQKYQSICPQCSVWTSLPEGGNLEVATIFECKRYGYGKRIKE